MSHVWGRYTLALLLSSICLSGVVAQQTKGKTAMKAGKKSGAVTAEKVSGRLPRHFGSIVDNTQRTEIYRIQISYRERIAELESELAELEAAEMKEIEGVLTADQLGQLVELRAGSSQRKSASEAASGRKASTNKASPKRASTKKPGSTKTAAAEAQEGAASKGTAKADSRQRSTSKKPAESPASKSRG